MTTLDSWTAAVCAEFGIDAAAVDVRQVLDLARDVAHQVDRPAAPVTAFLAGFAVGAGASVEDVVARVLGLVASWEAGGEPADA